MPELQALLSMQRIADLTFRAPYGQANRNGAVYGGQLLGQALLAAQSAFDGSTKAVHAMQACFEGAANATRAIDYLVEPGPDGTTECLWRVRAEQDGQTVLTANVAFGSRRDGFRHTHRWRVPPPLPEQLLTLKQHLDGLGNELSAHGLSRTRTYPQVEVRPVDARRHLLAMPGPPRSEFWIRAVTGDSGTSLSAASVLAYLSDYLAVNAALAGHVPELPEEPMFVASLNHTIWFHAEPTPGEWLYHELESPWAGGGRALCLGRIYSRTGDLQATVAQETLISVRRK